MEMEITNFSDNALVNYQKFTCFEYWCVFAKYVIREWEIWMYQNFIQVIVCKLDMRLRFSIFTIMNLLR